MHQISRHSDFANPSRWIMNPGIVYGPTTPLESVLVDGVIYHHNLARGTCFCQDSNFGRPYSTPSPRFPGKPAEIMCYMGAKGGRPYRPPNACWACRKFVDAKESKDRKLKKCSRCKAAKYCSVKCQKDHWSTHKLSCIEP
ncbi:hypothetical protein HDU99_001270 [Rhizoclosmatium hyalinum]|nr:hypothetical protein HDU99_001270 [Rhizoclosmatium hyalinum]